MPRLAAVLLAAFSCLAAMPANACAPPNVTFAAGSANLDAAALREIDDALHGYRAGTGTRFLLRASGHQPDPPSAAYPLARRRAEAVRAVLESRGVPARDIMIDISSATLLGRGRDGSVPAIWIERVDAASGCG